jgi:uncharacterized damage-inducible protein DinB
MKDAFLLQYRLLQKSRTVLFDFLEAEIGEGINTPIAAYFDETIAGLMRHTAACTINWLGYFALKLPEGSIPIPETTTIPSLRGLYQRVDELVNQFVTQTGDAMQLPIAGIHDACGAVTATPAELFTHIFTHEHHHKGQLLNMCRTLGHTPPDTDVSLFFAY